MNINPLPQQEIKILKKKASYIGGFFNYINQVYYYYHLALSHSSTFCLLVSYPTASDKVFQPLVISKSPLGDLGGYSYLLHHLVTYTSC